MFKNFRQFSALLAGAMIATAVGASSAAAAEQDWMRDLFDGRAGGSSHGAQSGGGDFFGGFFGGGAAGRYVTSFPSSYGAGQIIVSFGDRRLYYVLSKGKAMSYPIAIPKDEAAWSGVLRVSQKRVNPTWTPTADMRRENPRLPAFVEGGDPRNPLGVRALYLGGTLYRIHGTDAPQLIGRQVSHGCVRMYNSDVIDLYNRANVGTRVIVTWSHFRTS